MAGIFQTGAANMTRISSVLFGAAIVAGFAASAVPAAAGSPYDGYWSVQIMTVRGACDPSYRFDISITDGRVTFNGPADITGRVGNSGGVTVRINAGSQSANGSGRLRGGSGRGTWRGASQSARCSGRWEATRS